MECMFSSWALIFSFRLRIFLYILDPVLHTCLSLSFFLPPTLNQKWFHRFLVRVCEGEFPSHTVNEMEWRRLESARDFLWHDMHLHCMPLLLCIHFSLEYCWTVYILASLTVFLVLCKWVTECVCLSTQLPCLKENTHREKKRAFEKRKNRTEQYRIRWERHRLTWRANGVEFDDGKLETFCLPVLNSNLTFFQQMIGRIVC